MPFIIDPSACANNNSSFTGTSSAQSNKMPIFGSLKSKFSRKNSDLSSRTASFKSNKSSSNMGSSNPFTASSPPTRRPDPPTASTDNGPPPAYTPAAATPTITTTTLPGPITHTADDPYAFLSTFDTIFLIDDSGSMAGRSWRETSAALRTIAPICTAHDADGIDLYFLNTPDSPTYRNITTAAIISRIFETVRPSGGTPTGTRLYQILKPYLARVEREGDKVKPLNIIVVTDGAPSDDVDTVIANAARRLDRADVPPWQVGIQFFQVGEERGAAEHLRALDDDLADLCGARDMVDTVPWSGVWGGGLSADSILKCVLGAVTRRLDRKRNSVEVRR